MCRRAFFYFRGEEVHITMKNELGERIATAGKRDKKEGKKK